MPDIAYRAFCRKCGMLMRTRLRVEALHAAEAHERTEPEHKVHVERCEVIRGT